MDKHREFKYFLAVLTLLTFFLGVPISVHAQQEQLVIDTLPVDQYYVGEVEEILHDDERKVAGTVQLTQQLRVKIVNGDKKGEVLEVEHGGLIAQTSVQRVEVGERVVLVSTQTANGEIFFVAEKYRLPSMGWILGIFLVLVLVFGRLRGFTSILGMVLSIAVLTFFIVPKILEGHNPLTTSLLGAVLVAVLSLYMAHGFKKRTTVALLGTLISLAVAAVLSVLFVGGAKLAGFGSEEAFYLQTLGQNAIDLKGLLLGAIIIGTLGVLDDITVGQTATIDELKKANPSFDTNELYHRGLSVGREHIASLVNTLALAYVGAAFPLLLLFTINESIPIWVTLNSEMVAEEVIRTLVGSSALIFAVPITTFLAAYYFGKDNR